MAKFFRPEFSMNFRVVDGLLPRDTLFLHGNLASNLWWEPAIGEWQKQDGGKGRAILAEWRGCGQSHEFQGAFDLPTLANDCNALLSYLGLSNVNVVAHSTGGLVALHAMAARPELYHRALLLDPVSPEGVTLAPDISRAFKQMSEDKSFCGAVILGTIHGAHLTQNFKNQIVDAAFGVNSAIWQGVPSLISCPPKLAYERITHPVLVAHGEFDEVLPITSSEALAKALPKAKFMQISGRGHCTNLEDPDRFTGIANGFLF